MTEEEIKDLARYFRLSIYMDEGDILLEEYEELNDILKRNSYAREIDDAKYSYYMGKTSEEKYLETYNKYNNLLHEIFVKKYNLEPESKLTLK